ncbi:MAG: TetR/AcrR family transcriptional regulator [Rhodocyclaceae bacterium]|nr:MAG: TetR/AcrR family transcriptional regulator [Rhodocyclaceae bacterium]
MRHSCNIPSRREARRQDRRESILTVAARYFLEHGYSATTMSAIAASLGGSKGTLWSYFPSKEELFTAVIDTVTTSFRQQLSETLKANGDIEPALRNFCRQLLNKIASPDAIALNRLVVAEAGRFPEIGKIFYERAPRLTIALLADYLANAMGRGLLRPDYPTDAAYFLMHTSIARCQQQLLLGLVDAITPEQVEAEVERALTLFMRAYAPEPVAAHTAHP